MVSLWIAAVVVIAVWCLWKIYGDQYDEQNRVNDNLTLDDFVIDVDEPDV